MIESILSRNDDGINKTIDTPLKVMAGSGAGAPVIAVCPKDVLDPQWVISLNALNLQGLVIGEGLNIGQGDKPANPVVYLDKATGHVGLGTNQPTGALEVLESVNAGVNAVLSNPNEGNGAFAIHRLRTAGGEGIIFKNSNARIGDGGANAMTVRNDVGDLRLQAKGQVGMIVKADNGRVGINTENPSMPLEVNGAMSLGGNSLYFPSASGTVETPGTSGLYWHGASQTTPASLYGIYKTNGAWTGNFQQLRIAFATGIQLEAGTGQYGKSYVDIVGGKGLMVSAGTLGVGGASVPTAKAHVVTAAFDGDQALAASWSAGQMVVGADANAGGLAMGYSTTKEAGYLLAATPGTGYKDLSIKARNVMFGNGSNELMRISNDGKVGIGIATAEGHLHLRRDINANAVMQVSNLMAATDAMVSYRLQTDSSNGWIFKNGSLRVADGPAHAMTVRNDKGDLRLQAEGAVGLDIKATNGRVGVSTANPASLLSVAGNLTIGAGRAGTTAAPANGLLVEGESTFLANVQAQAGLRVGTFGSGVPGVVDLQAGLASPYSGKLIFGTDNSGWRFGISKRAGNTVTDLLTVTDAGNVGIGAFATDSNSLLHARRDVNGPTELWLSNRSNASAAYGILGINTDNSYGFLFKNSSTRPDDGGVNTMTLRNDKGDLRLQAEGSIGLQIKALNGNVGIGTADAATKLHVASTGKAVDGKGLLLGALNDKIKDSTVLGEELGSIDISFAGWRDNEPNQIGAKISSIRIASYTGNNNASTQAIQSSELAFFTGEGASSNVTNNLHETCFERMRIRRDGSVSIGAKTTASKVGIAGNLAIGGTAGVSVAAPVNGLHVEGETMLIGGLYAKSGLRVADGALGGPNSVELLSGGASPYSGRLVFGTDNTGWRFGIAKKAGNTVTDLFSVVDSGNVGIGSGAAEFGHLLHARRENNGPADLWVTNPSNANNAYGIIGIGTDNSWGFMFKNSSTRNVDGGVNTMTVRNDKGDLRLHAEGSVGLQVKAGSGYVVLGGGANLPVTPLTITSDGSISYPDGNLRISKTGILFGGANDSTREGNSAQISAGTHTPNSLCIVGMSDVNKGNRRVDMWAEGGFNLNGKMKMNGKTPIAFKRFIANGDGPVFRTGFAFSEYIVSIAGFFSYGDRATNGTRIMPTEPEPGYSDWKIVTDLHGPGDIYWEVIVMAVRREFAEFL